MLEQPIKLFIQGGPIMWPILILSLITATVVIERIFFLLQETRKIAPLLRLKILSLVEKGHVSEALTYSENSSDFVVKTLNYALQHKNDGLTEALMLAGNGELLRFKRGLSILDTAITLAPLLGLLGTVTGMITAFGMINGELGAPTAITGGIAEALIATAFGLGVAILALIPFNTLNTRYERAQHDIEDYGTHLELLLAKQERKNSLADTE